MMRAIVLLVPAAALLAQSAPESPLRSLPYTPSLDLASMDRQADPCVDFYRYACGGWLRHNPIPPDQVRWSVYQKLAQENQRFLWSLLDAAAKPAVGRSAAERLVGDYFHACMDEAAVERTGYRPLEPALREIDAIRTPADLPRYLAHQHQMPGRAAALFRFGSNQDFEDSERILAFASAGGLGLPDRDYYTKTDEKSQAIRDKYLQHVQRMLSMVEHPDAAVAGARAVLEIETALATASLTRVERRDPYKQLHKMSWAKFQEMTPSFSWKEYLESRGAATQDPVNVTEPAFFEALEKSLRNRPVADLRQYLRWHAVLAGAPYLSRAFVTADYEFFQQELRGAKQQQPRWKRCVQAVDRDLGEALGRVFVAKTFTPETKARTIEMTHHIQNAMEKDIRELPWMSEATKAKALGKLRTMVNQVGYPDKWRDYGGVRIERDDFAGNVRRAGAFESQRQLAKIGKPLDRGEWQMTPPTVNAYYEPQLNSINFPAGVLQPPLFDPKMDDAPNYGNTGGTIGHELTHAFDDEGRQFDAKGNLKDWWTESDAAEFTKRAECVSTQYGNYTVIDDIRINSKLTLGEDVADLGGTLIAYQAWREAVKAQKLKPVDGLSPEQRFFVGYAQWACGDERPESRRVTALTDPHSPLEYRVNGIVSNLPEFAAAFACKPGQPMVRERACRVW